MTVVPSCVVRVKLSVPTEATVPDAAGGVPPNPGAARAHRGRRPSGPPTATLVAVTVLEASVPNTATCAPTLTSDSDGEVTAGSS